MAGPPVKSFGLLKRIALVTASAAVAASIFSANPANATPAPVSAQAHLALPVAAIPTDIPSIHIVPGSVINLVSSESKVPVRIQNDFDSEIRVHVHMLPSNPRVSVPQAVEVVVPASSGINAQVPVKAIGNGKVFLIVWLTTFSGIRLTENSNLQMNVNAGIETAMLVVFASLIVALGTVGVLRTRSKRRRKARLETDLEAGLS
jgi:Family of unknown function (DUF6049)